jgi:hypothetical protein
VRIHNAGAIKKLLSTFFDHLKANLGDVGAMEAAKGPLGVPGSRHETCQIASQYQTGIAVLK